LSSPRVLLCGRPDLLAKPGGDTRQILGLKRCLGKCAALSLSLAPRTAGFDVVHVFNISRPLEPSLQAVHAKRAGLPVVCTPIFQDLREYNRRGRHGAGRWLFLLLGESDGRLETVRVAVNLTRSGSRGLLQVPHLGLRWAGDGLSGGPGLATILQQRLLESCRLVIFGSALEAESARRAFGAQLPLESAIVPVGIDPLELSSIDGTPFRRRFGLDRFILAVGRIEDLKNQLALVEALRDEERPLVIIGGVNPLHRGYARALARAAARRPRTLLLHSLPRELVISAMAAASVHALPSWFETTGLVSLEAAAAGCAVVSTDRGYARAVLGDDATYCDPTSQSSIRAAIDRAIAAGPSKRLRDRVLSEITEEKAALALSQIYERVAS
jgi:glycosyltransferase involved in cell wall biosynthesis